MGVEDDLLPLPGPAGRPRGDLLPDDPLDLLSAGRVAAGLLEPAVVPQADVVGPDLGLHHLLMRDVVEGRDPPARRLPPDRGAGGRYAEPGDPAVVAVLQPVVVAYPAEPLQPPLRPPGILDPEPHLVVADDGERMPTGLRLAERNLPGLGIDVVPALVHVRAGVEHSDLAQRAVHVVQLQVPHAEIGPERPAAGVQLALLRERARLLLHVSPERVPADAVAEPPLHGPADARSVV